MHYKKILFCGYGRAGKDEAAMFLGRITQLRYAGSFSWAGLPHMAKVLGVHPCQAWEERHKQRQFWKDELDKLRLADQCCLARLVIQSGDLAAGLRDIAEINAVKAEGLFDRIVWIDRPGTPVDPTVTYGPEDCHETLVNDGDLAQYHQKLFNWAVDNRLPLRKTDEAVALFRTSKYYAWSGTPFKHETPDETVNTKPQSRLEAWENPEKHEQECLKRAFVPVLVKPIGS